SEAFLALRERRYDCVLIAMQMGLQDKAADDLTMEILYDDEVIVVACAHSKWGGGGRMGGIRGAGRIRHVLPLVWMWSYFTATRLCRLIDLDIRLADDPGVFLGVRRIEFRKLSGTHRLDRLQGLLLQRVPDARNVHHFVETGDDLVDDRPRCAAWGAGGLPHHDNGPRVARRAYRRHVRQERRADSAGHGQCLESARVNVLRDKAERRQHQLHPVSHQVQDCRRCAVVRHGRYVELCRLEEASHGEVLAAAYVGVGPVENARMFPDVLYELRHGIDRNAWVNDEGRRKPHTGADRHEALLAPAKVRVQAWVGHDPRGDVSPSVSVGLGARDLVPGEVAARGRLRFDHDRLAPNLGKLVGDYACGNVSDPTRRKRQDQADT